MLSNQILLNLAVIHRMPGLSDGMLRWLVGQPWLDQPLATWANHSTAGANVDQEKFRSVLQNLAIQPVEPIAKILSQKNIQVIVLGQPNYPYWLQEIPSPPPLLYVRGRMEALGVGGLGVVGTRLPTPYGLRAAHLILEPVCQHGITIISGLARGIDAAAHEVALQFSAPTVAVLGNGLDSVYPWEHGPLAEKIIASGGALVSEVPLGAKPERHHFPRRNRIISGLSRAILLVEAGEKSGALITAKFALDQNREVLAIPGPITSAQSRGVNSWLKLGARPVTTAEDILEIFHPGSSAKQPINIAEPNDPTQKIIFSFLSDQPLHIDEVIKKSRLDTSVVAASLSLMEISGHVRHLGGMIYTRL